MGWPQVAYVGHVVEDLLGMNGEFSQVVQLPVYPLGVVPLRQKGHFVVGLAAVGVEPGHNAAHVVHYRVGADGGRFGAGAIEVGYVIDVACRVIAPAVIGAANGVPLNLFAVFHDHGAGAGGEVRAHVGTVGVQHDRPAAFAAVERQILAKEAHRHGAGVQLFALGHNKPAPRECVGPEAVVRSFCHGEISPC